MIGRETHPMVPYAAFAALLLGMAAVVLWQGSAVGQDIAAPTDVQLDRQQAALQRARNQASEARQRSETLEARAAAAGASADAMRGQILALAARIQEAEANIAASQARIAIIAVEQRRQRARLADEQRPMIRLTAALQNLARRPVELALVQPGSIDDMVHVRAIMTSVLPQVEAKTAGLRAEVGRGRDLRTQAESATQLLRGDQAALAERRVDLARLETQRRFDARRLGDSSAAQAERAIALGEDARDIVDLMARIETSGSVRQGLARLDGPLLRPARPGASATRPSALAARPSRRLDWQLPVVGRVLTGLGEMSDTGVRSRGLTLATQPQAQVVAPASGRIAFAGPYRGYGNILIIEHDGGWTSLVTDLAATAAQVGDRVAQGEPIGRAGDNEPRVMVELRRNGRPVDIAAMVAG